jgi:multidrug efflux pump subunit AcrB
MGEITFIALTSDQVSPMELRRLGETVVRRSLLAVPGISQVVPIGGEVREYLVELDPAAVVQAGIPVEDVVLALEGSGTPRRLPRGRPGAPRARSNRALASDLRYGAPPGQVPELSQIASVRESAAPARGTASYRARPAVILSVQKQPGANTLELTRRIDAALEGLQKNFPEGVVIEKENFRQADFIDVAIRNVSVALRDGAVLVLVVLFLFMGNLRATLISAAAIPLSLVVGVLILSLFGATLNTMTLGGFTIAIGALVDDAIIDVRTSSGGCARSGRSPPASAGGRSTWSSGPRPRCGGPSCSRRW